MLRESQDRKGVVSALLEHVAALEAELHARGGWQSQAQPQPSRNHSPSQSSCQESTGTQRAGAATLSSSTSLAPDTAATAEPSVSINHLSLSAVAEPRNRAGEFLKHLSTPRLITGVTETFGGNPESTGRVDQLWEAISQYIRHPSGSMQRLYIPQSETSKALNTYLDVVDFRYPRLAVEKVRSGISAISADEDGEAAYNKLINTSPAHIFMAYMVVAIVPLVSDSYPISQGSWVSAHLLSKCLKLLNRVFLQEDGVDIIQCLHLLIILSIHCSTAGSAWHLIGFAMNKCIALGYHREEARAVAVRSESDTQQRRWAFWGCYLLDRLICAGLGRPFSIADEDISVPLPSEASVMATLNDMSSSTPNSDTSTSLSTLRTHAYIHLFRYAILLSSAAKDRSAPNQDDTDQAPSFDDLLGQALYWRTTSPTRGNPAIADINAYQMSLHNTLLLRAAICELNNAYEPVAPDFEQGESTGPKSLDGSQQVFLRHRSMTAEIWRDPGRCTLPSSSITARVFQHERDHIRRINLLGVCRAVGRSLDRSRMTSRPYLSFLTGYSSLSMGLACVYYMTISQYGGEYNTNMVMPTPSLSTSADLLPRGSSSFSNSSLPPALDPHQRNHSENLYWDSEQRLYADPQALVDLACRKLEVVGRQFPRLQEYCMLLEKLRALVCRWSMRFCGTAEGSPSMHDHIAEFRRTTKVIGPPHLRTLAEAVLYLLAL